MEPEGSLPHSQASTSCPYPGPAQSSPHTASHLLEIRPNIHPSMPRSPQWSLSLWFPYQDPICATCPAHLILLYFITRTILGEEYRSFSPSLCSLLHSTVTLSLLGPIFSTPYSQTPSASFPPSMSVTKFHTHTKQQAKL